MKLDQREIDLAAFQSAIAELKEQHPPEFQNHNLLNIPLEHGDVLIFDGDGLQEYWEHDMDFHKKDDLRIRIILTSREMVRSAPETKNEGCERQRCQRGCCR